MEIPKTTPDNSNIAHDFSAATPGMYVVSAVLLLSAVALGTQQVMTQGIVIAAMSVAIFLVLHKYKITIICPDRAEKMLLLAGFMVIFISLLSLIPLPRWLLNTISPFGAGLWTSSAEGDYRAVSVAPESGFEALVLYGASLLAYFWGRSFLAPSPWRFTRLFFYGASVVGLASIVLFAVGAEPANIMFGWLPFGRLRGFYTNENRFAVWLSMALLLGVAWYLDDRRPDREKVLCLTGLGVLFIAVTLTASRGTFLGLVAASVMMLVVLSHRLGDNRRVLILLGAMPVSGLLVAAYIHQRLASIPTETWRLEVWSATLKASLDFPGWGCGLGAYGEAFPRYQPEYLSAFYRHAHNDFAELCMELGLAGLLFGVAFLYLLVRGWHKLLRARGKGHSSYTAVGMAVVTLIAVTSFVDFPLRQPSNLLLFAVLLGMVCGRLASYTKHKPDTMQSPVWLKWGALAILPLGLILAFSGGVRILAPRLPVQQALGLLRMADAFEPGPGENLKTAAEIAYKQYWNQPGPDSLDLAVQLNRKAVDLLPFDGVALYRAGLILSTAGDISRGSRLIEKSVEMSPAYSDLRKKAAKYYVARYIYERGRASANISYLSRVLAGYPEEQLAWFRYLLDAGIRERIAKRVIGQDTQLLYVEELLCRKMWQTLLDATSGSYGNVIAFRAAALVMLGREADGLGLIQSISDHPDHVSEQQLKMAISVLPDKEGKFLRTVAGKLDKTSENLRWLIQEANKRGLMSLAMPWAAMYFNMNRDAWGYRMYACCLERLGSYDDAARAFFDGVMQFPEDTALQKEAEAFVQKHRAEAILLESLLKKQRQ